MKDFNKIPITEKERIKALNTAPPVVKTTGQLRAWVEMKRALKAIKAGSMAYTF